MLPWLRSLLTKHERLEALAIEHTYDADTGPSWVGGSGGSLSPHPPEGEKASDGSRASIILLPVHPLPFPLQAARNCALELQVTVLSYGS